MTTSIHHFIQAVDSLFRRSIGDTPQRTRQRPVLLTLSILLSGSLTLRRMASTQASLTPQTTCAASHERRLRRALNDPLLTWERSAAPLVRRILTRQRVRRWVVILDETAQAEHLRVLTATLRHRGRAIPRAWVCWPGQTKPTVSSWERCRPARDQVAQALPAHASAAVAADRAFGGPVFTDQVAAHGWNWLVRVHGPTRWQDAQGRVPQRAQRVAQRGARWKGVARSSKMQGGGRRASWRCGDGRAPVHCCWSVACRAAGI